MWTEWLIQNRVGSWLTEVKNLQPVIPNVQLYTGECDLIGISQAGLVHEVEIKVSRSDFKADAKKAKHLWFTQQRYLPSWPYFRGGKILAVPNYFWYASPEGLIDPEELPDYAGLLEVNDRVVQDGRWTYWITAQQGTRHRRAARRLHTEKIPEGQLRRLERSLYFRYWRERFKDVLEKGEERWASK